MADKHLELETLDVSKLVKSNKLMEVTNPIFFIRNGVPSEDGLLSNEIFGITRDERANIFAYIDLTEDFIDPLSYKMWSRTDSKIKECVHGTKNFIINSKGELEENENGKNGIKFLKDNMDKIKIKTTDSTKRDTKIDFIMSNYKEGKLFINKYLVIPAYFRDVNNSNGGKIGVGEINTLYNSLLIAIRSLKEAKDYGITLSSSVGGRVQEIILEIYNWFTKEPNLSGKNGIIKRSVMSKTADRASRLVLSAPNLRRERLEDLESDLTHTAMPLASLCANLYPFIVFWIRRHFENQFASSSMFQAKDKKTGKWNYLEIDNPLVQFSDENIKKQLDRFISGYSNRFIPVEAKAVTGETIYLRFKGTSTKSQDIPNKVGEEISPIYNRRLTWCDLIYMAAVDAAEGKHVLITRYPLNDYYGQFPTAINVVSTKDTEPMYVDMYGEQKFYKNYPKIRDEDIGKNTSNKFIDTMNMCNLHLEIIGGDYDGDQVTAKVVYSDEANAEIEKFLKSKRFYIDLGGKNVRVSGKEAIQTVYNLTLILPGTKLTNPVF